MKLILSALAATALSACTVSVDNKTEADPNAAAADAEATTRNAVDDVDAEFARLNGKAEVVHEPKLLPWGNRTAQFRDPEGTLVALYTPVSDAAKQRFAGR